MVHAGLALSCELDSHENKTLFYYTCVFKVHIVECCNFCNAVGRLIFDACSQILQTLRSVASGVSLTLRSVASGVSLFTNTTDPAFCSVRCLAVHKYYRP